jgi:ribosomal protein L32
VTQCNIPEDLNLQLHCSGSLKSEICVVPPPRCFFVRCIEVHVVQNTGTCILSHRVCYIFLLCVFFCFLFFCWLVRCIEVHVVQNTGTCILSHHLCYIFLSPWMMACHWGMWWDTGRGVVHCILVILKIPSELHGLCWVNMWIMGM